MAVLHEEQTFTYELVSANRKKRFVQATAFAALLAIVGGASVWAGFETARRTLAIPHAEASSLPVKALEPVAASQLPPSDVKAPTTETSPAPARNPLSSAPPKLDMAELDRLSIQDRAERLLQSALQGNPHALNLLRENVDSWRGHLKNTESLFDLVLSALNSADLQVRTAALDLDLAANNLSKTPQSVDRLLRQMQTDPSAIGMNLWRLGALGNRGVQPEKVLQSLLLYAGSRNEHTRYWAVEGLGMLGNDAAIDPLLTVMAHDASPRVRELAASSLAHAGMLTREERLAAVPSLLNFADDDSINTATRELVYGTLRVITGAELGNDAAAWRQWWADHDPARIKPHQRAGIVRT
jgi:HEAT repeats